MEEFVTEIQTNIGNILEVSKHKPSKFRELICKVLSMPSNAEVVITKCDDEGDIDFEVNMKAIGITMDTLIHYRNEISTQSVVNFIGELLIRDNIDKFAKLIIGLKNNYADTVNKHNHGKFGMKIHREKFIVSFHISFVQRILIEDFHKKMM
jgi:hypothetical protein